MQSLGPVKRTTLTDQVAEALLEGILPRRLRAGDVVGEADLAGRLQVNRTPVCEAIQRLVTVGVLTKVANRSVGIALPSLTQLLQVQEAREALESMAARLFAGRAGPGERSGCYAR